MHDSIFLAQVRKAESQWRRFTWLTFPFCMLIWLLPGLYAIHLLRAHAPKNEVLALACFELLMSGLAYLIAYKFIRSLSRPVCPSCNAKLNGPESRNAVSRGICPKCNGPVSENAIAPQVKDLSP